MKYLDNTTYQNLNSKIKSIKWAIYLPTKHGSSQTSANLSLAHHASSLLKEYLKNSSFSNKYIYNITANLKQQTYQLTRPLKGYGVAMFIYEDSIIELFDLPFELNNGYVTDVEHLLLQPIHDYYESLKSYYVLDLHYKKTKIYELAQDKLRLITAFAGNLNDLDKQISDNLKNRIEPIILIGSYKMAHAYKKASHNKQQIIGYVADLPAKLNALTVDAKLVKI